MRVTQNNVLSHFWDASQVPVLSAFTPNSPGSLLPSVATRLQNNLFSILWDSSPSITLSAPPDLWSLSNLLDASLCCLVSSLPTPNPPAAFQELFGVFFLIISLWERRKTHLAPNTHTHLPPRILCQGHQSNWQRQGTRQRLQLRGPGPCSGEGCAPWGEWLPLELCSAQPSCLGAHLTPRHLLRACTMLAYWVFLS